MDDGGYGDRLNLMVALLVALLVSVWVILIGGRYLTVV